MQDVLGLSYANSLSPRLESELVTLFTPSPFRVGHPGDPYSSPFGTGWSFQPVLMTFALFFPNPVLFVIFFTVYSFIIAKHTRALQYYTFIGHSCSFSENI